MGVSTLTLQPGSRNCFRTTKGRKPETQKPRRGLLACWITWLRTRLGKNKEEFLVKNTLRYAIGMVVVMLASSSSLAKAGMSGTINGTGPKGETYTVTLYGDLVLPAGAGALEDALIQGKGQKYIDGTLVETGVLESVTDTNMTVAVGDQHKTYRLTDKTRFSDAGKDATKQSLKLQDVVTVISNPPKSTAVNVRKGPMLFKQKYGVLVLEEYK